MSTRSYLKDRLSWFEHAKATGKKVGPNIDNAIAELKFIRKSLKEFDKQKANES